MPGVHVLPEPNAYRCPIEHCRDDCDMTCLKAGLRMFDMASDGAPAAMVVEPIISAGGVLVPPEGYFEEIQKVLKNADINKKIHPKAKTIMITAFKDEGQTRKRLLEAGVYAYFEKPINSFKELEEAVNKAVRGVK